MAWLDVRVPVWLTLQGSDKSLRALKAQPLHCVLTLTGSHIADKRGSAFYAEYSGLRPEPRQIVPYVSLDKWPMAHDNWQMATPGALCVRYGC
jgi:hypothetical protein